ncbi:hypothetical protein GCM10011340_25150 [Roseivirga thermotolerans]|uniref:Sensor of ECF-type sigma factor n=2 Tax=Roseivirga thermotolerans TaxID=1758176 RepID=A0ABQ3I6E8_9BACT|nr:hypothetical protein GCM10011340_25150 [Roseivirga thermotolerans]
MQNWITILNILTTKIMRFAYILLLAIACNVVVAQDRNGRSSDDWEKLKAARIAFLSNRLQLTSETAQKFWPIFNEYEKEKDALSKKYNEQKRNLVGANGWKNMTDENADKMLEVYLEQKQAELDLEKKYLTRFNEVLDKNQIWMVIRIDSDFRRSLMKRISDDKDRPNRDNGGNRHFPQQNH